MTYNKPKYRLILSSYLWTNKTSDLYIHSSCFIFLM